MRKRKWRRRVPVHSSAVLIMGLYAGPAFAEWIGTGGARAYIINGQVQTGWQQIDGKWYYLNEQGAPQIGWVKTGRNSISVRRRGKWSVVSSGSMENLLFWHTRQWRDGNGRCQYQRNSLYV